MIDLTNFHKVTIHRVEGVAGCDTIIVESNRITVYKKRVLIRRKAH